MVKSFVDYHLVGEEPKMISLSSRIQVLRSFRCDMSLYRGPLYPVSCDIKGVKASTTCGCGLLGVPGLPPLQLPQPASRGRGGWRPGGQARGGGGGLGSTSATCKTGLVSANISTNKNIYFPLLSVLSNLHMKHASIIDVKFCLTGEGGCLLRSTLSGQSLLCTARALAGLPKVLATSTHILSTHPFIFVQSIKSISNLNSVYS